MGRRPLESLIDHEATIPLILNSNSLSITKKIAVRVLWSSVEHEKSVSRVH
jgi:hypothetical protein